MDTELSTAPDSKDGISQEMSSFAHGVYKSKYAMKHPDGTSEEWIDTAYRVTSNVLGALGYTSHDDSREGWAELGHNALMALQTGAGIGIDYSDVRASGLPIRKTGGVASGPLSLMKIINEIGRNVMQGGSRRSAIWAGLNWKHPDVFKFIHAKKWPEVVVKAKEQDFMFPADLDMTNISVLLDDEFFVAHKDETHELHAHAVKVYNEAVESMIQTAEPGLSVDVGDNAGETLRNACTEVTSGDDSDICNLGSINLARVESLDELEELVKLGTLFLLAGTVYSHVPYDKVDEIRTKNRRLGLGVMGIHEWLLQRGKTYGADVELEDWLNVYETSTEYAEQWADKFGLTRPIKTRAIAPTGTIGIVAETTTGIEPIFCAAYKRRVREASPDGDVIKATYVIDPTAKRLLDRGVDPNKIEDAYALSYDVERRLAFQSWVQQYVDHGISSTINLPYPITDPFEVEDFKQILMKYLPELRGVTCYPEGAISGQPITPVPLEWALQHQGEVLVETEEDTCKGGVCGA
jgi:ribonucleoside-diphosphate reductase alpha chain